MGETDRQTADLSRELTTLLDQETDLDNKVRVAAPILARALAVAEDEVAVFLLDERKTVLHFLWPERLKQIGFIPYSSIDSLAARTAREARVFMNNTFASQHHASFFEKIRLKQGVGDRPLPIQKIISVPMLVDDEVRGVVQISRKGADESDPLADFTEQDAARLIALAAAVGRSL